jgi:hypothetical protein
MKQKDKAKWQKDIAKVFEVGYAMVSDGLKCSKQAVGFATRHVDEFANEAGEEIVDAANEVGDALEDTFGPDGYIVEGLEEFNDTAFAQWFRKDLKNFFEHDLGEGLTHAFKDKLWEEGLESFFTGAYNEDIEEWFETDVADAFADFGGWWGDGAIDTGEALGDLRDGINDQLDKIGVGEITLGNLTGDIETLLVGIPTTAQDIVKFAEFVATGDFSAAEALLGEGLEDLAGTVPGKILAGGKKIADRGFNEVKSGLRSVSKATQKWANDHLKNEVTVAAVKGINEMVNFVDDLSAKTTGFLKNDVLPAIASGLEAGIKEVGGEFVGWLKGDVGDFFQEDVRGYFNNVGVKMGDGFVDVFTGKIFG